nr:zinc finger, CCHC-type [Tanacetum cinerariifolium]
MVIKNLDLEPKKELSKETSSKILPCGDGSCWKTFKPIASLVTKGKLKETQAHSFPVFTVKKRYHAVPYGELDGIHVAFVDRFRVVSKTAGKEAEWLRNLSIEIPLWSKTIAPISIRCDSATTLAKAYRQIYNGKSRHLGVRHSMIHKLITNEVISIEFVREDCWKFSEIVGIRVIHGNEFGGTECTPIKSLIFPDSSSVDRYMDNKLEEVINKAIQAHNYDCKEETQAEKMEYIELVDSMSLEAAVLTGSISQPQSSYKTTATLFEFELAKILIDKMEKNKSFDIADYKRELYNALVKSYNTDKYIFESYGEVFSLKRSQDDKDKDQDPSTGSDRWTKRKKSSKDAESFKDSRSKEKNSLSTSKDASQSQHKSFGKSAYAEEPSHTVEYSGIQQDQEFSKRQQVDFRPLQTWISQVTRAEEPPTLFDELNDTSFDFSAFVMNRLQFPNLTQEISVRPAFNLLKGTCKTITKLEYHFEECSKATTERLDWRKRLMRADELYKFSDGTLNDVWSALHEIAAGIRMEYLPRKKYSNLDKKRARVMVQDIDKQLYQRRWMRNLKKLVDGREYENDLRLLERII